MSRRTVLCIVVAVVGVNALLWLLDSIAPGPSGRPSSSLATTPRGFSAWAELAQRNGVEVVALRDRLRHATLPPGGTVVALDVPRLPRADARALKAYAEEGGHVVAGGVRPGRWIDELADLRWAPTGARAVRLGDRRLLTAGRGSWEGDDLAVTDGGLTLLADSSPLQN